MKKLAFHFAVMFFAMQTIVAYAQTPEEQAAGFTCPFQRDGSSKDKEHAAMVPRIKWAYDSRVPCQFRYR
jgi:hypothetical protein